MTFIKNDYIVSHFLMYTKSSFFWRPLHSVTWIYRLWEIRDKLWHGPAFGSDVQGSPPGLLQSIVLLRGMILDGKQVSIARSTRSELGARTFLVQSPSCTFKGRMTSRWCQNDHKVSKSPKIKFRCHGGGPCTKNNLAPNSDQIIWAFQRRYNFCWYLRSKILSFYQKFPSLKKYTCELKLQKGSFACNFVF